MPLYDVSANARQSRDRADRELAPQSFGIDALIRAADPFESRPVLLIDFAVPRVVACNAAVDHVLGFSSRELEGMNPARLHPDDTNFHDLRNRLREALESGQNRLRCHSRLRRRNGETFPAELTMAFVRTAADGGVMCICTMRDLSGRNEAAADAVRAPLHTDSLTGLPDAKAFRSALDEFLQGYRCDERPLAVAAIDIKRLHLVNQSIGGAATDEIIRRIGRRLTADMPGLELLGRAPRGEFLLAVDPLKTTLPVSGVGARLVEIFQGGFPIDDGTEIALAPSIGIVLVPDHGQAADELLFRLDAALSEARKSSAVSCVYFEESIVEQIREDLLLERQLRAAIEADAITPHYQPQIELESGALVGFEALARWTRADGQHISPVRFIPLAEKTGLIGGLERSLLRQVMADVAAWQARCGMPPVSVNISGRHLAEEDFDDWYLAALRSAGLEPAAICLEITESTYLLDLENTRRRMRRLVDAGVSFSLDDFGTGYSSLSYLAQLPFRAVKIDRSFVVEIENDLQKQALVRSVMNIADALDIHVVAEGVETEAQRNALIELGCRRAQGYLFGKAEHAGIAAGAFFGAHENNSGNASRTRRE